MVTKCPANENTFNVLNIIYLLVFETVYNVLSILVVKKG